MKTVKIPAWASVFILSDANWLVCIGRAEDGTFSREAAINLDVKGNATASLVSFDGVDAVFTTRPLMNGEEPKPRSITAEMQGYAKL